MEEVTEMLSEVNWSLIVPILIIQFVLMVIAFVDCFRHNRTNGPQWVWILVIVFFQVIGPILYFIFGRRND
ncbi:Phospholipase_D-nuclease N-terminal [Evansella caseinilytica]|uniref:Phospholipase_D-nuclease N-terminal n=1 Tax=Evansella caseinilytica TaxID=1503961 RepID=A0A1H3TG49_9BACI|nr:PLD nuclease N-terminal domain-containing protein [Evansella caseinilytica]SDZ49263.1 Phospholipase_D-nuclease N-terminal [Evansella caseinilytica]